MKIELEGQVTQAPSDWYFDVEKQNYSYSDNIVTAIDEILEYNGFDISESGQKFIITVEKI